MLVKMLPEQISQYWPIIKYAIEGSLPPIANESPEKMNNLLTALLSDQMQCWVSYREEGEEGKRVMEAILVTTIVGDYCSSIKSLMIYSLYGFSINEEAWISGFETIRKWGKAQGCNRIIAYSDVPRVIEVAQQFGGEAKYTFISLPL
jgi:hypothetical protein